MLLRYWKSIVVSLTILFLSFARFPSVSQLPKEIPWDKIVHFIMYLSLTFILMYDNFKARRPDTGKSAFYFICVAYPLVLGVVTEICQSAFFATRAAEWSDWFSNTVGFFTGWGIFMIFKRKYLT